MAINEFWLVSTKKPLLICLLNLNFPFRPVWFNYLARLSTQARLSDPFLYLTWRSSSSQFNQSVFKALKKDIMVTPSIVLGESGRRFLTWSKSTSMSLHSLTVEPALVPFSPISSAYLIFRQTRVIQRFQTSATEQNWWRYLWLLAAFFNWN